MTTHSLMVMIGLTVVAAATVGLAEELPMVAPAEVGLSAEGLEKISQAMRERVEKGEIVGGSVLVSRRGKVAYFESFGLMDAEAKKPWRPDTIARIYSMTKGITSAAVLMLVDEGKISLDDPVEKHVPELKARMVYEEGGDRPAKSVMTVKHLLLHTSGLIYGGDGDDPLAKRYADADLLNFDGTLDEFVGKLAPLPLKFDPGTDWHYGVSIDVLGAIVERASGRTLDEFLHKRMFEPLGMVDTGFEVPPEKLERFAAMYERQGDGWKLDDAPSTNRYARKATFYTGGGGLVSTSADYWRFLMIIAGGGEANGKRLLKRESVDLMTHNQLDDVSGWMEKPGTGFGLGFRVVCEPVPEEDKRRLGEYGWAGKASTHYWTNPREELTVITLEQTLPYGDATFVLVQPLVYDAIEDAGE